MFYDLAKISLNRLAFSQGHELATYGATAVSITPGWLRSEMMLDNYGVSEDRWRDALAPTASPQLLQDLRSQSRRDTSAERSRRSRRIPTGTGGISGQ